MLRGGLLAAGSLCGCVHSRSLHASCSRPFLNSFVSARIANRERQLEEKRQRQETERMLRLTKTVESSEGRLLNRNTLASLDDKRTLELRSRRRQEFYDAIFLYNQRYGKTKRGHVEFIEASLRRITDYGVQEDLNAYKALMELFPKEKMRVRTMWQGDFKHYPRQQDTANFLMDVMLDHKVMPDTEFGHLICRIFGTESYVMAKYQRIMYWMPKLRHADPWPSATLTSSGLRYSNVIDSSRQLAALALARMCPDTLTTVTNFDMEGPHHPFVTSAQAPDQLDLLNSLKDSDTVYLDGPFRVWYKKYRLNYYVLCSDPKQYNTCCVQSSSSMDGRESSKSAGPVTKKSLKDEDFSWWQQIRYPFDESSASSSQLVRLPTVHEQSDMTILALAVPSSDSRELLLRWVRLLAEHGCEKLKTVSVVFRIRTGEEEEEEEEDDDDDNEDNEDNEREKHREAENE